MQQETNTTTREELEKMDPEEALTYVTTPGGGPLTLEDVQAKLAGLGSFKSHPYETMGATGVRDALIAEIVKSVKSGMRGESLVDEKASHGALTRTKSQGSNLSLTLAKTASVDSVPDDGDTVQQGLVLKLMTENAQLRQRAKATESSGVQGALATLPEDFAEALANVGKQTRRASMGAVSSMMRILGGWLEEQLKSEPPEAQPRPETGKLCAARNPPTLSCPARSRCESAYLYCMTLMFCSACPVLCAGRPAPIPLALPPKRAPLLAGPSRAPPLAGPSRWRAPQADPRSRSRTRRPSNWPRSNRQLCAPSGPTYPLALTACAWSAAGRRNVRRRPTTPPTPPEPEPEKPPELEPPGFVAP